MAVVTPVRESVLDVTPEYTPPFARLVYVPPPLVLSCHWKVLPTGDEPTLIVALPPLHAVVFAGCAVIDGGGVTTITADPEFPIPGQPFAPVTLTIV